MHIAIYTRVSTGAQNIESQLPDLKRWVAAYGDDSEVIWYTDKATGKTMDRPGWNSLEEQIHDGGVSKLVVWRLDRLGRTASGLTRLFETLVNLDVGFESVCDKIDLSTPAGRLIANVLASVAAYETEIRGARVRAGIEAARANGKRWGGSKPGRQLTVTDEKQRSIRLLLEQGAKVSEVARQLRVSRTTVYAVKNQA